MIRSVTVPMDFKRKCGLMGKSRYRTRWSTRKLQSLPAHVLNNFGGLQLALLCGCTSSPTARMSPTSLTILPIVQSYFADLLNPLVILLPRPLTSRPHPPCILKCSLRNARLLCAWVPLASGWLHRHPRARHLPQSRRLQRRISSERTITECNAPVIPQCLAGHHERAGWTWWQDIDALRGVRP